MSTLPSSESKWRRILRLTHLWMGVALLIPLVVIGLTGSVLVFHHEIADLTGPGYRASTEGEIRPLGEIVAAAQSQAPQGYAPTLVVIPEERGEPAAVRFLRPGAQIQGPGGSHQILLDPATLEVFGAHQPLGNGFMRIMHRLHGSLMISGGTGRDIVGWLGVVMLALGISGLVMWWPKKRQWRAAFTVARGAKGYRLHRELHGALGIWTWVVFIVVSFSGVYIAFPNATGDMIRVFFPARDVRASVNSARVAPIEGIQPISIDDASRLALAAAPDARIWVARYPARPDQPYRFSLIRAGHEHGQPSVAVAVDPWRGTVVDVFDPRTYTAGETIMAWQRGIHGGEGLGWTWKILVFLSGLLPVVFGITGIAMWLMRRRAGRRAAQRTATEGARI